MGMPFSPGPCQTCCNPCRGSKVNVDTSGTALTNGNLVLRFNGWNNDFFTDIDGDYNPDASDLVWPWSCVPQGDCINEMDGVSSFYPLCKSSTDTAADSSKQYCCFCTLASASGNPDASSCTEQSPSGGSSAVPPSIIQWGLSTCFRIGYDPLARTYTINLQIQSSATFYCSNSFPAPNTFYTELAANVGGFSPLLEYTSNPIGNPLDCKNEIDLTAHCSDSDVIVNPDGSDAWTLVGVFNESDEDGNITVIPKTFQLPIGTVELVWKVTESLSSPSSGPHSTKLNPVIEASREKLGITLSDAKHYAAALWKWGRAGFPTLTVEQIAARVAVCQQCDQYIDERCAKCGCYSNRQRMAIANKAKMRTEDCPLKKWPKLIVLP